MQRLKQLATFMRDWQNTKFVYSKTQKLALIEEIDSIDKLEAKNLISNTNSEKRKALKAYLIDLERKEALYWSQRTKKLWIKEGEENSAFFHKVFFI